MGRGPIAVFLSDDAAVVANSHRSVHESYCFRRAYGDSLAVTGKADARKLDLSDTGRHRSDVKNAGANLAYSWCLQLLLDLTNRLFARHESTPIRRRSHEIRQVINRSAMKPVDQRSTRPQCSRHDTTRSGAVQLRVTARRHFRLGVPAKTTRARPWCSSENSCFVWKDRQSEVPSAAPPVLIGRASLAWRGA